MIRRSPKRLIYAALALALAFGGTASGLSVAPGAPVGRVLAIGDVHGAYDSLVEILRSADLLDEEARWIGGDATLVQVGDFLDRGEGVLEVMDLLMRLQEEASRKGGRVVVLLGNHEAMNLLGVMRDVSPAVFARLAGPDSERRREELCRAAAAIRRSRNGGELPPDFDTECRDRHPPGYAEYFELLAPEGKYGRWLRSLPAAYRLGDMFFLHAGLDPAAEVLDAEEISSRVHRGLELFDRARRLLVENRLLLPTAGYAELLETAVSVERGGRILASLEEDKTTLRRAARELLLEQEAWILTRIDGPLWFRGFAKWRTREGAEKIRTLRRALGVEHFVVGHSPVRDRSIHHRFEGAIFLTDTGMLAEHYQGGRPALLERVGERWSAVYLDGREVLLGPGPREALAQGFAGPDGEPLPFRSDAEALDFLRTAEVVSREVLTGGTSRTLKVLLEKDGVRAHGAFRTIDLKKARVTLDEEIFLDFHDSYRYEVAAYEMSRLLGLDQIPPVVERKIQGELGSLQLWVEGAMTETERHQSGAVPPDGIRWYRQLQIMRVFDRLIFNYDRNRGNMLIGEDGNLWMIDHTRSFRLSPSVPAAGTVTHCEKDLWRRLRELEEGEVRERLLPYMGKSRVRALMKRRDRLVRRIEELIATFGEEHVIFDLEKTATPEESTLLAESGIESFLDDLPDESEIPPELTATAPE